MKLKNYKLKSKMNRKKHYYKGDFMAKPKPEQEFTKVSCNFNKEDAETLQRISYNEKYKGKYTNLLRELVAAALKNKALLKSLGVKC